MSEQRPMTVAQLIERLTKLDPDLMVMVYCEDNYYEGPLDPEMTTGWACLTGSYDYQTPSEDERGRKVPQKTMHNPGGRWVIVEPDGLVPAGPLVERHPCVILRSVS